jgi:C-terminal processing protease CtpA/Prc
MVGQPGGLVLPFAHNHHGHHADSTSSSPRYTTLAQTTSAVAASSMSSTTTSNNSAAHSSDPLEEHDDDDNTIDNDNSAPLQIENGRRRHAASIFVDTNGEEGSRIEPSFSRRLNSFHTLATRQRALIAALVVIGFLASVAMVRTTKRHNWSNTAAATTTTSNDPKQQPLPCNLNSGGDDESSSRTIHYDASVAELAWNPWDLKLTGTSDASLLQPQPAAWRFHFHYYDDAKMDTDTTNSDDDDDESTFSLGYITQPDMVNGTVVFVSEGELYWTRRSFGGNAEEDAIVSPAVKLTTCRPGRVQTPKINPVYPHLIAFVANYQAVNEVYLLDLRASRKAAAVQRLTYTDSLYGVTSIVGWKDRGQTLVYGALSTAVGLRDLRMYEIALVQNTNHTQSNGNSNSNNRRPASSQTKSSPPPPPFAVLETRSVPLAQAVEGVWGPASDDNYSRCLYFVRVKQYSFTARYVGGTVEQMWAYCDGHGTAVPLTSDFYAGTSKAPQIWSATANGGGPHYLLFLSDRSRSSNWTSTDKTANAEWIPGSMNLWAVPLPTEAELYSGNAPTLAQPILAGSTFVPLTNVACQWNGWALREYAVDAVTGHIVLRIGADLHWLSAETVRGMLTAASSPTKPVRSIPKPNPFPIQINSDFVEQQERIIEIDMTQHLTDADVFETDFGMTGFLATVRGQLWVLPAIPDASSAFPFQGSAQNLPERRYRVIPGGLTGGSIRVLQALVVPRIGDSDTDGSKGEILALVLATDPVSPTGELGFYLVQIQPGSVNSFVVIDRFPKPFVGGNVNGGSSRDGGLGTVKKGSVVLSPCGRRFAWADMDDRICTMTLPVFSVLRQNDTRPPSFHCLPKYNDMGEPMAGTLSELSYSPGGRYLAVNHKARNQMRVISIVDCGEPGGNETAAVLDIQVTTSVQVTSKRFNSFGMLWGKSRFDALLYSTMAAVAKSMGLPRPDNVATTLFYLSDRDISNDVSSPWGSRAPSPHFQSRQVQVFALPLLAKLSDAEQSVLMGRYAGGGGMEVFAEKLSLYERDTITSLSAAAQGEERRLFQRAVVEKLSVIGRRITPHERALVSRSVAATMDRRRLETTDQEIHLPSHDPSLMESAYRVAHIPVAEYSTILSQTGDGSLACVQGSTEGSGSNLIFFAAEPFPADGVSPIAIPDIGQYGLSTSREFIFVVTPKGKFTRVVPNTVSGIASFAGDTDWNQLKVDTTDLAISVWPSLEYKQMFSDAWRLLRDYFYDPNMHGVDWMSVFVRYEPLVQRCGKREELDDVLAQMVSELSALHTYVYTGESSKPDDSLWGQATLGAGFRRTPAWNGFTVTEIPEQDPDFNTIDRVPIYSPLSDQALRLTGQKGLQVGDVIVAVNGESVMYAPDVNMLLRGSLGRSVRLDVLRLASGSIDNVTRAVPEPLITVPIHPQSAYMLRVNSWEWRTRQQAKQLASDAGFTVGYAHLQSMHSTDENAFARAFYPDYDADAFIVDVRHNDGGFIDSWILDTLQRKAWMFWSGRNDARNGEMDWDEQYAFRGKLVVLQDEYTASNAEGFCRGVSELRLGRLVGKRTWGGGIWGSSSNTLVDGGIATAPQWGTFNAKFGWGGGVEMTGVSPDIEVDNDPRMAFDGRDSQLERAILELKEMLEADSLARFETPGERPNKALQLDACKA